MQRQRDYVVKSDIDNGIVFDAKAVAFEARRRRITTLAAARAMASENSDSVTGETLYAQSA